MAICDELQATIRFGKTFGLDNIFFQDPRPLSRGHIHGSAIESKFHLYEAMLATNQQRFRTRKIRRRVRFASAIFHSAVVPFAAHIPVEK